MTDEKKGNDTLELENLKNVIKESLTANTKLSQQLVDSIADDETRRLALIQDYAEGKTIEEIKQTSIDDLVTHAKSIEHTAKTKAELEEAISRTHRLFEEKITDLGKTLNKNIKDLMDHNHEHQRRMEEYYPKRSKSKGYEERQARVNEETRKWLNASRPLAEGLTNQAKERNLFGSTFKLPLMRKVVTRLHNLDQKVGSLLENIANAEFVVTRDNIVSKTARNILGIRLPYEPEFISTNDGKKTKWQIMLEEMRKDPAYREADPDRVTNNEKHHDNTWADFRNTWDDIFKRSKNN